MKFQPNGSNKIAREKSSSISYNGYSLGAGNMLMIIIVLYPARMTSSNMIPYNGLISLKIYGPFTVVDFMCSFSVHRDFEQSTKVCNEWGLLQF